MSQEDRKFGAVFAFFFLLAFLISYFKGHHRWWFLIVSFAFLVLAIFYPTALKPFHWLWKKIGDILHRITSPILLTLTYYTVFFPIGFILVLLKKDLLKINRNDLESYWVERDPPGPEAASLVNQF